MLGILHPVKQGSITMKHKLLPTQENSVFERLQAADMNPADFEWVEGIFYTEPEKYTLRPGKIKNECPVLRLKKQPQYYFQFEFDYSSHDYTCSPGNDCFAEKGHPCVWIGQLISVENWAGRVKNEIEAPDLWADLNKYQIAISTDVTDDGLNEIISASDAEDISSKLEILGDEIQKVYSLTSEQDRIVRSKLKYLEDAAKRSRTQDWVCIAIATFQTIMMVLVLTPEQQLQMLGIIKTTLGNFMNLIK